MSGGEDLKDKAPPSNPGALDSSPVQERSLEFSLGKPTEQSHNIPHGSGRLIIISIALGFCLFAGFAKNTPSDTRTTFLSIASAIVTALIRPFDRN